MKRGDKVKVYYEGRFTGGESSTSFEIETVDEDGFHVKHWAPKASVVREE